MDDDVDDDEMKMTMRCYAAVCQATGARRQVPGDKYIYIYIKKIYTYTNNNIYIYI